MFVNKDAFNFLHLRRYYLMKSTAALIFRIFSFFLNFFLSLSNYMKIFLECMYSRVEGIRIGHSLQIFYYRASKKPVIWPLHLFKVNDHILEINQLKKKNFCQFIQVLCITRSSNIHFFSFQSWKSSVWKEHI